MVCFFLQMASAAATPPFATIVIVWLKVLILLAMPFVFAGMGVSLALTRSPFKVGLIYGVDLTGAAGGCLAVLVLLNTVDASSAVLVIAAIAAGAAWCFSRAGQSFTWAGRGWRVLQRPGVLAMVISVLGVLNASTR
jgi:hypothetical protein